MICLVPAAELLGPDVAGVAPARTELRLPASVPRRLAMVLTRSETSVSTPPTNEGGSLGGLADRSAGALAVSPSPGRLPTTPANCSAIGSGLPVMTPRRFV